jgi:hypothetical protein
MKLNLAMLAVSIATSIVAIPLLTPIASLALPTDTAKPSASDAASPPVTPENTTKGQPVTSANIEQLSSSQSRSEGNQYIRRGLGICSIYIPPGARPGSYEYREGLNKCWYGSD